MGRKAWDAQLKLLTKVRHDRLPPRQAFMANMLGNVRQLLLDLPLDKPLINHTNEEIIALVRKAFRGRSAKRDSLSNPSIGRPKRKRSLASKKTRSKLIHPRRKNASERSSARAAHL